jgi:hypothetical protein
MASARISGAAGMNAFRFRDESGESRRYEGKKVNAEEFRR